MSVMIDTAQAAKRAASDLGIASTDAKNTVLNALADRIDTESDTIVRANQRDLDAATQTGITGPKLKRLTLSGDAIGQMADGLRQIAALPDPIGQVTREYDVPSGLRVRRVRCPIGVIMMIYEARPNVTIDAFALCFKAGNACILKGGREAQRSNEALAAIAHDCLRDHDLATASLALLTTSDRNDIRTLLGLDAFIDLVIPRGGTELIRFVHEHSRIPMVQHFHGVCHIFVDRDADVARALDICVTAKTSAPATCNAAEAVLVHEDIADGFIPQLVQRLQSEGVEVRGDEAVCRRARQVVPATSDDWGTEFLDLIMAVRVVSDLDAAIEHVQQFGSNHTDAIITENTATAATFTSRIQSSCTIVNASTRFNDGFQLGLGAEIGISTSKIHAYGPMGLEELTTQRFVVVGDGQFR